MAPPLFTDFQRTDHSVLAAGEPNFSFLNRCAWPAATKVRTAIQDWYDFYPASEQADLAARLHSNDDRHFASATFELVLHEYLRRLGMKLTPHPVLPNGSDKRPDFLVECKDGARLYLEAVGASEDNGANVAAEARKGLALQATDEALHPDFMLLVDSEGDPTTQPSGKRLARAIHEWLEGIDPDEARRTFEMHGPDALPKLEWEHEAWKVAFRPYPVTVESRGRHTRMIGMRNYGASWVDTAGPIRTALTKKARRYGQLDLPLVVAINVSSFRLDPDDEVSALFGTEQYSWQAANPTAEPRFGRASDGAWRNANEYRGRRASGAWFFDHISPYTVARARNRLYVHPAPHLALPESFLVQHHAFEIGGRIQRADGATLGEVLGLPQDWPE